MIVRAREAERERISYPHNRIRARSQTDLRIKNHSLAQRFEKLSNYKMFTLHVTMNFFFFFFVNFTALHVSSSSNLPLLLKRKDL